MAPQLTFGAILQEAREHKGMEVGTAARRLRIRPDILRAIEAEDFSRMPPRGYTRNMINAYARLVGLNPSEITRMYLDAAYAFQVGKARTDSLPSASGSHGRSRSARQRQQADAAAPPPRQNALGRTLYDDRRTFTRGDYDVPAPSSRLRQSERTHPSRHAAVPGSQYTNFYAGPRGTGAMQSRLPFVIAGVIILVLLIVILVLVFGPKDSQNQQDVSTVPITGLNDTTQNGDGNDGDGGDQAQQTLTAPTSVTVEYRVSSSSDAYVEISVDGGDAQPSYLAAGTVETVDVTGTWSLSTWTTDLVQVTVDGEVVEFTQDGTTIPTCTVDFNAYLDQWITDHPGATITSGGTSNASSGTGSGSTGTNAANTTTASSGSGSASSASGASTGSGARTTGTNATA